MNADSYVVGEKLGETEQFRMYKCELAKGKVGILKIATSIAFNGILDREAYILGMLRDEAIRYEKAFAEENPGTKQVLNYQVCFPNLVESFIAEDQGGRRINILDFVLIDDDLSRWVPIAHIASRDHVRVDPRTSAWIIGKLLKLLAFAHDQGVSIGQLTGENILIERDQHFVAIFDWSQATPGVEPLSAEITSKEVAQAATEVILALGGDPLTGILPKNEQLVDDRYATYLHQLSLGKKSNAFSAHREFYKLIRSLWPREFHPFTTYNLERNS